MAEEMVKVNAQTAGGDAEVWIPASDVERIVQERVRLLYAEVSAYVDRRMNEVKVWAATKIEDSKCTGACGVTGEEPCTIHTRLSSQRIKNLRRKRSHTFDIPGPLAAGASVTVTVPAYQLGRVIEYFSFRPTMDTNGDPNQLRVTIRGEDGVEWAQFAGGKHSDEACCLLEWFEDDCIGWNEGWTVTIQHIGTVGDPAMKSAVLDYNYVFPGQKPVRFCVESYCYPKSLKGGC